MSPQVLFIGAVLLLTVAGYVLWSSRKAVEPSSPMRNGKRRDIWDEVEGKVTSIAVKDDAVLVGYEFLTPRGSQHAMHRFTLDVSEPYQFGSREADLAHAAERWIRAYPVNCPARVRFNPRRLTESVLTRPRGQNAPVAAKVAEGTA